MSIKIETKPNNEVNNTQKVELVVTNTNGIPIEKLLVIDPEALEGLKQEVNGNLEEVNGKIDAVNGTVGGLADKVAQLEGSVGNIGNIDTKLTQVYNKSKNYTDGELAKFKTNTVDPISAKADQNQRQIDQLKSKLDSAKTLTLAGITNEYTADQLAKNQTKADQIAKEYTGSDAKSVGYFIVCKENTSLYWNDVTKKWVNGGTTIVSTATTEKAGIVKLGTANGCLADDGDGTVKVVGFAEFELRLANVERDVATISAINDEIATIKTNIGQLQSLTFGTKTSVVVALNELKTMLDGKIGSDALNDYVLKDTYNVDKSALEGKIKDNADALDAKANKSDLSAYVTNASFSAEKTKLEQKIQANTDAIANKVGQDALDAYVTKVTYDTDKGQLESKIAANAEKITQLESTSGETLQELNKYKQSNDAKVNKNIQDISNLTKSLEGKLDSNTFNTYKQTNDAKVNANTGNITALSSELSSYKETNDAAVAKNKEDIGTLDAAVKTKLDASIFNSYKLSNDAAVNKNKEDIQIVGGKVDTKLEASTFEEYKLANDALVNKNKADIADIKESTAAGVTNKTFEAYKEQNDLKVSTNTQAIADITGRLDNVLLGSTFEEYKETNDAAVAKNKADIGTLDGKVKNKLETSIFEAYKETNDGKVTQNQTDISGIKKQLESVMTTDNADRKYQTIAGFDAYKQTNDAAVNKNKGDIATINGTLANKLDSDTFNTYKQTNDGKVNTNTADIAKLKEDMGNVATTEAVQEQLNQFKTTNVDPIAAKATQNEEKLTELEGMLNKAKTLTLAGVSSDKTAEYLVGHQSEATQIATEYTGSSKLKTGYFIICSDNISIWYNEKTKQWVTGGVSTINVATKVTAGVIKLGDGFGQLKNLGGGLVEVSGLSEFKQDYEAVKNDVNTNIKPQVNKIGNLESLTTDPKDTLVNAINYLKTCFDKVGDLGSLTTDEKTTIVSAINSLKTSVNKIGDLNSLTTTAKDTLVNAIIELKASLDSIPEVANIAKLDANNTFTGDVNTFNNKVDVGGMLEIAGKLQFSTMSPTIAPSTNTAGTMKFYDTTTGANCYYTLDLGSKGRLTGLRDALQDSDAISRGYADKRYILAGNANKYVTLDTVQSITAAKTMTTLTVTGSFSVDGTLGIGGSSNSRVVTFSNGKLEYKHNRAYDALTDNEVLTKGKLNPYLSGTYTTIVVFNSTVGTLSNLTTTNKSNLVAAINEVKTSIPSITNLVTLNTTQTITGAKTIGNLTVTSDLSINGGLWIGGNHDNRVVTFSSGKLEYAHTREYGALAANEVLTKGKLDTYLSNTYVTNTALKAVTGDLSTLTTTNKDNLVAAVNEVKSNIPSTTNLMTLNTDQTATAPKKFTGKVKLANTSGTDGFGAVRLIGDKAGRCYFSMGPDDTNWGFVTIGKTDTGNSDFKFIYEIDGASFEFNKPIMYNSAIDPTTANHLVRKGWVDAQLNNVVKTTGNQSIDGGKIFLKALTIGNLKVDGSDTTFYATPLEGKAVLKLANGNNILEIDMTGSNLKGIRSATIVPGNKTYAANVDMLLTLQKTIEDKIGNLPDLTTPPKDNLVLAVNYLNEELKTKKPEPLNYSEEETRLLLRDKCIVGLLPKHFYYHNNSIHTVKGNVNATWGDKGVIKQAGDYVYYTSSADQNYQAMPSLPIGHIVQREANVSVQLDLMIMKSLAKSANTPLLGFEKSDGSKLFSIGFKNLNGTGPIKLVSKDVRNDTETITTTNVNIESSMDIKLILNIVNNKVSVILCSNGKMSDSYEINIGTQFTIANIDTLRLFGANGLGGGNYKAYFKSLSMFKELLPLENATKLKNALGYSELMEDVTPSHVTDLYSENKKSGEHIDVIGKLANAMESIVFNLNANDFDLTNGKVKSSFGTEDVGSWKVGQGSLFTLTKEGDAIKYNCTSETSSGTDQQLFIDIGKYTSSLSEFTIKVNLLLDRSTFYGDGKSRTWTPLFSFTSASKYGFINFGTQDIKDSNVFKLNGQLDGYTSGSNEWVSGLNSIPSGEMDVGITLKVTNGKIYYYITVNGVSGTKTERTFNTSGGDNVNKWTISNIKYLMLFGAIGFTNPYGTYKLKSVTIFNRGLSDEEVNALPNYTESIESWMAILGNARKILSKVNNTLTTQEVNALIANMLTTDTVQTVTGNKNFTGKLEYTTSTEFNSLGNSELVNKEKLVGYVENENQLTRRDVQAQMNRLQETITDMVGQMGSDPNVYVTRLVTQLLEQKLPVVKTKADLYKISEGVLAVIDGTLL